MIERNGGASRDRTDDLIVANDALSQLSYSPEPDEFLGEQNYFTSVSRFPLRSAARASSNKKDLTNLHAARLTYH